MTEDQRTSFYDIEQFFVLEDGWRTKSYFDILDNLYLG
jgi:hypothetical protein